MIHLNENNKIWVKLSIELISLIGREKSDKILLTINKGKTTANENIIKLKKQIKLYK